MKKTFIGSNIILLTIFISFLFSPFDKLITNLNANQGNKSQQFYKSIGSELSPDSSPITAPFQIAVPVL